MERKLLAANWKMHKTLAAAEHYLQHLTDNLPPEGPPVVLAVPAPYLQLAVQHTADHPRIGIYAQNIHHEASGAFTGEVSAEMVKSIGAQGTLIGHSERRTYQRETHLQLAAKVNLAIRNELNFIYCVGETQQARDAKQTEHVLAEQLDQGLFHLALEDFQYAAVAYEPVWAIGTGNTATPQLANAAQKFIRNHTYRVYEEPAISQGMPLLYGGSVKAGNAADLFAEVDIDGALVGGASLDAEELLRIAALHSESPNP